MKRTTKYFQLLAGIFSIIVFITVMNGLEKNSASLQKIKQEIEQQGIEADALFYTESPKAMEAAFILQQKTKGNQNHHKGEILNNEETSGPESRKSKSTPSK